MKKYTMIVETTSTGYSAYNEVEGAYTIGNSMDELECNIIEVLNLALSDTSRILTSNDIELQFK